MTLTPLPRKTYTFNLDDNPMFCVITHIVSIAFDDEAFGAPGLTSPEILFQLQARHSKGCQPISWKEDMLDVPIFRRVCATKDGVKTSPDKVLPYNVFQGWIKRLGEALGYLQTLTTYCLRRALGNAINGTSFPGRETTIFERGDTDATDGIQTIRIRTQLCAIWHWTMWDPPRSSSETICRACSATAPKTPTGTASPTPRPPSRRVVSDVSGTRIGPGS